VGYSYILYVNNVFLSLIFFMRYVYNTRGMNIFVVLPFIRPRLRNQGTK
jgi:hypothetical protein